MHEGVMKAWLESSHLGGGNMAYVDELYESYLAEPTSVGDEWREFFAGLPKIDGVDLETRHADVRQQFADLARNKHREVVVVNSGSATDTRQVKVLQLINSYRFRGHQHANLDPLNLWKQPRVRDLELSFHDLSEADYDTEFNVGSFASGQETMKLGDLHKALEKTYCGSIGAEYMHIVSTDEKRWIQQRLEGTQSTSVFDKETRLGILKGLVAADGLEKYLGSKFPGAKRFGLEGGDAMIPMLKAMIHRAGEQGAKDSVIGMAHRGRLNTLINVLGKNPSTLFDEFAGKYEVVGAGDVKYHMGFSSDFATKGGNVHLALAFNPSHLEIVNPVVIGSVRARLDRRGCTDGSLALPITIHGDSAFAGQGVVAETFNISQTRAFKVGGTVRVVINNQVGFTTSNPEDTRSTPYCTDIAKMVLAPIFHVNGDDPEAVVFVAQLAVDYRNTFKRDVVIDLFCYRRNGHNESDEPNATQPLMYQKIKKHPTPREIYATKLINEGVCTEDEVKALINNYRDALDTGDCVVDEWQPMSEPSVDWTPFLGHDWDATYDASMAVEKLVALGEKAINVPENVTLQRQVNRVYEDRALMLTGEKKIDWGMAEILAYAATVADGNRIRFVGQDSGRGTFFHRHAVLHNQDDGSTYTPLTKISDEQGPFQIFDSALSEEAVLAIEYGYATAEPRAMVIWEAQFGDFANGAQVVIDQFLSSGEQKWGRLCGLTLLLPHGYEGQGPEHSSARLERFLQLCADHNMQVCIPTTPAQVFNMLRRQMVRPMRRPLIVMSPKSLLRHPQATSSLEELASGKFLNVIGEIDDIKADEVKRVVFCSGKVYYELLEERRKREQTDVAIVRVEQLYPFPRDELMEVLSQYQHVTDFVWCQEEPQNQGAWYCSQHHFRSAIPKDGYLSYAGREASSSPAVGYLSVHNKQQQALVNDALSIK
ncbi:MULTISPECIES: 2-oxoglutarate dehydrogenase E1 component [unclassified Arsukibacterium]|uniref:2-oxoglutarate dehydrogenase E1 component n=1 Tax=unclassified Arsukibacterium TaxID=2635278 RepID=UPI000C8E5498|nr:MULTISPECIES: 2-oxoglutarate dehydrogenase E1 component [unclassified Arsukibacterium]MAA95788.1 2-oxoglutarate dehydrogenase E1 component [Rheinheimera sp.]|tara:strand:- start:56526 stop:59336 length:2811 start_codon:yes stop_codon:yes gene_type:complete